MIPYLFALLITDAWIGPTHTSYPASDQTSTVYSYQNNTGHSVYYGGSNPGYSVKISLYRAVVLGAGSYYGSWGEPLWSVAYSSLGDFSSSQYATQDTNNVTTVPDGSIYVHDVTLHRTTDFESFTGGSANPGHTAVRQRNWTVRDPSTDNIHVVAGGGGD